MKDIIRIQLAVIQFELSGAKLLAEFARTILDERIKLYIEEFKEAS